MTSTQQFDPRLSLSFGRVFIWFCQSLNSSFRLRFRTRTTLACTSRLLSAFPHLGGTHHTEEIGDALPRGVAIRVWTGLTALAAIFITAFGDVDNSAVALPGGGHQCGLVENFQEYY